MTAKIKILDDEFYSLHVYDDLYEHMYAKGFTFIIYIKKNFSLPFLEIEQTGKDNSHHDMIKFMLFLTSKFKFDDTDTLEFKKNSFEMMISTCSSKSLSQKIIGDEDKNFKKTDFTSFQDFAIKQTKNVFANMPVEIFYQAKNKNLLLPLHQIQSALDYSIMHLQQVLKNESYLQFENAEKLDNSYMFNQTDYRADLENINIFLKQKFIEQQMIEISKNIPIKSPKINKKNKL